MQLCQAFYEIVLLCERSGVKDLARLPGCFEFDAGDFHFSLNAHQEPMKNREGIDVPPFGQVLVKHMPSGWPVGIIAPNGGALISSGGEKSAEDHVIEALRATPQIPDPVPA